ncbi:hypothetical protein BW727_101270 [Jeotgalibaca dankookensis]|uniref:MgtC/SapB/SrpB/YhiD N-terminal domain-containing protein n=1 Tax=Jeotgalibaca dankookensis TaxID=708126 RepID=A0A1S6IQ12_9LACT|nr:MgtC/SapB family protein [Jeotgalibaca dankookensis]AQS53637.1 hypothetical protein BW727_101270 [Jeotgalibaca dankookensis]
MYILDNMEVTVRLVVAVLIGSIIGLERERKNQSAGIRTNIIVCVSACILTIIQIKISFSVIQMVSADPELHGVLSTDFARITAQIVSGIGFLGAGAILTTQMDTISGLTTAATIWAVSGLGIAVGMGYYFLSISSTLILISVLYLLKKVTKPGEKHVLIIKMTNDRHIKEVRKVFETYELHKINEDFAMSRVDGELIYTFTYFLYIPNKLDNSDLIDAFLDISDEIVGITIKD